MLVSRYSTRKWPVLDHAVRWGRSQCLLWLPYVLFFVPVTLRFFVLVVLEAVYNLYLFFFTLPQSLQPIISEGYSEGDAIVTGGTSGIGKEIARALILAGYHVHLPVRDMAKGRKVAEELGVKAVTLYQCNLSSIPEVLAFIAAFKSTHKQLELLVNGLESHMAIHVLGTFLLTTGLASILHGGRVVNVSSSVYYIVSHFDLRAFCDRSQFSRQGGYSNAKYAQTLLSMQLALDLREHDITVNCVHPGMVNTDIIRSDTLGKVVLRGIVNTIAPFIMLTPKQGALTPVWAALSSECDNVTGRFFSDLQEEPLSGKIFHDLEHGYGKALFVHCENLVKKASNR
ncbi:hypothetical protein PSACC_03552 [Paramicrosporidium saccamoebae]|uniref:Uncharacterized protein n=1 Tax=Paramicrosporidium saccamoebae TaxID=1246581 RepID=A0A2H9TFY6_9FUNG|nr:hypothetical protein PSACC_03552 [Paramicrosporidium saccamoebae]